MKRFLTFYLVGALVLAAGFGVWTMTSTLDSSSPAPAPGKAAVRNETVSAAVVASSPVRPAAAGPMRPSGFTENVRLGFDAGVGWEPAIATDDYDHVYVLYAQYWGVPGCPECASPTAIVQISSDGGETWASPKVILEVGEDMKDGQWDPQIVVDPVDGRTVYAGWLNNTKGDIVVAKSTDFGETWTTTVADSAPSVNDKPILTVRGQDVYTAYNHLNTSGMWFSSSHDWGETFTSVSVRNGPQGLALPGGGGVTSDGTVFFSWESFEKSGNASGETHLYVTRSYDGGETWEKIAIGQAWPGPQCFEPCGWAFLSSQLVMAVDEADNLYVMWDGAEYVGDPGRVYFRSSRDGGDTWSEPIDVSNAPADSNHNFPAVAAMGDGEVAIAWQDARNSAPFGQTEWNTWYRFSDDGGETWSEEVQISSFVEGAPFYVTPEGYRFPYGDYFEIEFDATGNPHLVWGAGESYFGVGNVWYSRGYRPGH